MIPFGSQRASGQELATHLLNAQDNEQIEIAELRGARPDDLHGAFAQWRRQARERTRCRKYLYSLSINPDPAQGPLTRAQYADYIARVEAKLGLTDQPRAVVFHIKHGREHCHVVWSRIDAAAGRAVQISFDRTKLMAVTRAFARDHGLRLPEGYYREPGEPPENAQVSLYEKVQEDRTGLTKEQRIAEVTGAWQRSDSPKAFVRALEELGYILARGKRPYVLVDLYGEMNALAKLIADDEGGRRVRTKDIRAFLEDAFPPETLPTVDEAKAQAAQRRKAREDVAEARSKDRSDAQAARLKARQSERREALAQAAAVLTTHHAVEFMQLAMGHHDEIMACERAFDEAMGRLRRGRKANAPTGLAAFLGRITGMNFLRAALRAQQDARRRRKHEDRIAAIKTRHAAETKALKERHTQEQREMARKARALARTERREWQSFEAVRLREARVRAREAPGWYPVFPARKSASKPVRHGHQDDENAETARLIGAFARVADSGDDDGDADDGAAGRFAAKIDPWIIRAILATVTAVPDTDDDDLALIDDDQDIDGPPDWLRELLGHEFGDDDDDDDDDEGDDTDAILDWLMWPLSDEFNAAAGSGHAQAGGGGGRSPDVDPRADNEHDMGGPEPPRPSSPKPPGGHPRGPGKR